MTISAKILALQLHSTSPTCTSSPGMPGLLDRTAEVTDGTFYHHATLLFYSLPELSNSLFSYRRACVWWCLFTWKRHKSVFMFVWCAHTLSFSDSPNSLNPGGPEPGDGRWPQAPNPLQVSLFVHLQLSKRKTFNICCRHAAANMFEIYVPPHFS